MWTSWKRCTSSQKSHTLSWGCTLIRWFSFHQHPHETFTASPTPVFTRRSFSLWMFFSGGESLQREKLPHHECPRENAQRPGLSSRFISFFLLSWSISCTVHVSSFFVIDLWFCFSQYVSEVVIGAPFAVTKDLLDHFKASTGSTVISHHQDINK